MNVGFQIQICLHYYSHAVFCVLNLSNNVQGALTVIHDLVSLLWVLLDLRDTEKSGPRVGHPLCCPVVPSHTVAGGGWAACEQS